MKKIVRKAISGDEKAFLKLYDRYYRQLYYLALKITKNPADASDAVQDAFLQIQESINSLRNPDFFNVWASKIVYTKCVKLFSRNKYTAVDPQEIKDMKIVENRRDFMPAEKHNFENDQQILQSFLDELKPSYREILLLLYYSQFSIKEISLILDIPEGTVKSRSKAARDALKKRVEEFQEKEHRKLDFNIDAFDTALISLFAADFGACSAAASIPVAGAGTKLLHNLSLNTVIQGAASISLIAVVSTGGVMAMQNMEKPSANVLMQRQMPINERVDTKSFSSLYFTDDKEMQKEEIKNPREAYFSLRKWAYSEEEMKHKTKEEIRSVLPIYKELKNYEGGYWKLLELDGWAAIFESYL